MAEAAQQLVTAEVTRRSLITRFADKYSIEPNKLLDTLKDTAFRQRRGQPVSNEQMAALLVVADQYGLNPFTKELYAFPQDSSIVPIVGLDGWARIINERPELDGIEFEEVGEPGTVGKRNRACPQGITGIIYRKDRAHPTKVTEWIDECYRDTQPWNDMPRRMLRHKALIQCARIAFGFGGIYDEDEGQRIIEGDVVVDTHGAAFTGGTASAVNDVLKTATGDDDAPEPQERDDNNAPAEAPEHAENEAASEDTTTEDLLTRVRHCETFDALEYCRTLNKERDATPQAKGAVTKAIESKSAALIEAGVEA